MIPFARAAFGLSLIAPLPAFAAPLCPGLPGALTAPPELEARIAQAFAVAPEAARDSTIRCNGPRLLACLPGANLNCGLADTRRALPGVGDYCAANPDAGFIPMSVTGHATIYDWRCSGAKPVAGRIVVKVDSQGHDAGNWKEIR